jgi:hypothetical protein
MSAEKMTAEKMTPEQRNQYNQIFNIGEQPIMQMIAKFLGKSYRNLFHDKLPSFVQPLILMPFDEYKKDKCIKFTLIPTLLTDKPVSPLLIDSIIDKTRISESIGFLWYCLKEVFISVVNKGMLDNKAMHNITLELDESNWVFYFKYTNILVQKKNVLEQQMGKIIYIKQIKISSSNTHMI